MPQQSPISFPMGTKNVLIIDGNEAMQQVRARVLIQRSSGVLANNSASASKSADQFPGRTPNVPVSQLP